MLESPLLHLRVHISWKVELEVGLSMDASFCPAGPPLVFAQFPVHVNLHKAQGHLRKAQWSLNPGTPLPRGSASGNSNKQRSS